MESLFLLLHSHRADLGADTGEGNTRDSSLSLIILEPQERPQDENGMVFFKLACAAHGPFDSSPVYFNEDELACPGVYFSRKS